MRVPASRVFISHSSTDRAVVEALVHALEASLRLSRGDIRCTSLPGYKLEGGARTPDAIRSEIEGADFVLGVLSTTGERSDWVRFELGAAWALRRHLIPILIDLRYEDLPEPIRDLNALRASDENDVLQLIDEVAAGLGAVKDPLPRILEAVRRVTAVVKVPPGSTPPPTGDIRAEAAPVSLNEESVNFLKIFAERDLDHVTADEVAPLVGVSVQKARYIANNLKTTGYLYDILVIGEPITYGLSQQGRSFLIEHGYVG
jgi:hypothetical protein